MPSARGKYKTAIRTHTMTSTAGPFAHQSEGWTDLIIQQQSGVGTARFGLDQNVDATGNGIDLTAGQIVYFRLAPNQKLWFSGTVGVRVSIVIQSSLWMPIGDWLTGALKSVLRVLSGARKA